MIPTGLPSGGYFVPEVTPLSKSPYTTDDKAAEERYNEAISNSGYNYQSFKDMIDSAFEQQLQLDQMERDYNSAEAQKNRDFQEMMSNSAVQRMVKDLEAAGLNKWLALNGGSLGAASTPSGSQASAQSSSSQYGQIVKAFLTWMASLTTSAWKSIASILPF